MGDILTSIPNSTYLDQYIKDGQKAVVSLKNLYDTILLKDANNPDHICRIPWDDFFLKYREQLKGSIQYHTIPDTLFYKPKTVSFELYGTTELWLSLLRVNNMRNVTEFHYPLIKVYNPTQLAELINIFFKREKIVT